MTRYFFHMVFIRPPGRRLAVPLLFTLAMALVPVAGVRASVSGALGLPRSVFPAGTAITHRADTSSTVGDLHTQPFSAFGETRGYAQTARWSPAPRTEVTLHYHAALYLDAAHAAAAYGDARESLWEYGRPVRVGSRTGFRIQERDGKLDVALVIHRANAETELELTYNESIGRTSIDRGLGVLDRAAAAGTGVMMAAGTDDQTATTPADPLVYVAPAGTGPVIKSPSLMVMQSMTGGPQTPADPGAFRSSAPGITGRGVTAKLIPAGGLSRYAVTSPDSSGSQWYNAAILYGDSSSAAAGMASIPGHPVTLAGASQARLWQQAGERVLVFRSDNVLEVLAGFGVSSEAQTTLAEQIIATIPTWLHAQGTQIVDGRGNPVHLAALNWYGAESPDFVVGGLDFRSYQDILQTVSDLGYNAIRLPFSNQLVEQNPVITGHLVANPALRGMHALDILDAIVNYAGALGLSVVLDNHRSEAGWSTEPNGLWYTPQYSDAAFVSDWTTMAARYARNNAVVGLDLRNEPHATATWGDGNPATDWQAAAQRAGNAALAVNPNVLIIVEGVQFYGSAPSAWWGANLIGVATAPVQLHYADGSSARDRLVYSAHDYGPGMCGTGCPWFNSSTTYASLAQVWDSYFGYIVADPTKPYAAPVWMGEFGTCNVQKSCVSDTTPGSQGQWFASLVQYLSDRHMGWAYWSANGTQSSGDTRVYGQPEGYGLLTSNWMTPTPYVHDALHGIMHDAQQPSSH
jgi:endoglucanase